MSDYGHNATDELLAELEKKIKKQYQQAVRETRAKLDDYLRRFEIKDEKWQLMVANGTKTAQEYKQWRIGQIMVGQRWQDTLDTLAADYHNANMIARSMIINGLPDVYALNHNYGTYQVEKLGLVDTAYALYDRKTVERLMRDEPQVLQPPGARMRNTFDLFDAYKRGEAVELTAAQKKAFDKLIASGKDIRWQKGQIQSVTLQSILQGESIPNMSKRIAQTMGEMNHAATIRYARTAVTGAQNAGRQAAYERAEKLGVEMQKKWIATLDNRTRHEHRLLDGQIVDTDKPFKVDGYDIMYPGDTSAPGFLIWNCRCTTRAMVKGWESKTGQLRSNEAIGDMPYEEWKQGHSVSEPITKQEQAAARAKQGYINEYINAGKDFTGNGKSGTISKKFTDRLYNEHLLYERSAYTFDEIETEMVKTPIGAEAAKYISDNGYSVAINYDLNAPPYAGEIWGKNIVVYAVNNFDAGEISATIIHELCHERYQWNRTIEDEVNCRLMELMHTKGTAAEEDIRRIVDFVKREYSEFPEGNLYGY